MTIVDAARSPAASTRTAPRALPDAVLALGVGLYVALLGVAAALLGVHFFYVGDNPESFIPLWHHFGTQLRDGQWNTMEASGWMGGNYAGEAAYAQWNPFLLIAYIAVSFFGDLALGASVIMISMLSLLGIGAYGLMRSFGAGRAPSVALAGAVPFTGFTLFYEAAGWPAGLAALVGVTYFWLAVRKQTLGQWPPIVTFVFGYLAVTTGNPYALLGILIVLFAVFVETLMHRRWRPAIDLVVVGALVGAVALLIFLPLLAVQPVTVRQELAGIINDTFLVPDLGDLAAASTASYLPTITNWSGAVVESLPSTYLAWFALPLLPWLRWGAMWHALRKFPSVIVVGLIYGLATLGPSNLWLFRWPIRLIEYLYLVVLVVLAIGMTNPVARSHSHRRLVATSAIVIAGAFLAISATPDAVKIHAVGFAVTVGLLLALWLAWQHQGLVAAMVVILAGTALVTSFQTIVYPRGVPTIVVPSSIAQMEVQSADFEGTVLQLAQQTLAGPEAVNTGKLLFGNLSAPLPYESVNRYSGISFRALSESLCIDYKGVTCPDTYGRVFEPVANTQGDLADGMLLGTLVLQRASLTEIIDEGPPPGWRQAADDDVRVVWVRDEPLVANGRVSGVSQGVQARSITATEMTETVEVVSDSDGYVTFARLAWPGYAVRIDDRVAPFETTKEGLLQVAVPAGDSIIELSYTTPGLAAGWAATGVAAVLALIQTLFWYRSGPHRRAQVIASADLPTPAESTVTPARQGGT